jgi:hypothetical protein
MTTDLRLWGKRVDLCSGEIVPPWWYGRSYDEMWRGAFGSTVFHPIPLNLVVRAWRWIAFAWARLRGRPSWFDRQIRDAERAAFERGVTFGRRLEREERMTGKCAQCGYDAGRSAEEVS